MLDRLSELIGRIYEAVSDPSTVDAVLTQVIAETKSDVMVFGLIDTNAGEPITPRFLGNLTSRRQDGIAAYTSGEISGDPTLSFCLSRPGDRLFATHRIMSAEEHARDSYIAWNRHFMQTSHWLARTSRCEGLNLVASVHPRSACDAHDEHDGATFNRLFDHVARAHRLAARPLDGAGGRAVVQLDASGKVIGASPAAERLLALQDGLTCSGGRLRVADSRTRAAFDKATGLALAGAEGTGTTVSICRPSARPPILALIDAVPIAMGFAGILPGVRILLIDSALRTCGLEQRLSGWHLTSAEARLAALLAATDFDLRDSAERAGITYATARTHLARIYAKTETRSQPELMRLLVQISG